MIHFFTLFIEHGVGEVVVFIDDEIKLIILFFCVFLDSSKLVGCYILCKNGLSGCFIVELCISVDESVKADIAIRIEAFLQVIDVSSYL